MAPVRVRPRRRRALQPGLHRFLLVIGSVAGAAGLGLLLTPHQVAASLFGDRVEVGGMVLREATPVAGSQLLRYQGDASYVLDEHHDGTTRAAAVWTTRDAVSSGVCTLHAQGVRLIEECAFTGQGATLTAVDVLDPSTGPAWQRTYSDGWHVAIGVSADGGVAPVPLPIGH